MYTDKWKTDADMESSSNSPNDVNLNQKTSTESVFEQTKRSIADKLWNVSGKFREQSNRPDINRDLGYYGQQTSEWLARSAGYINDLSSQQIKDDVKNQVRVNPGRTLLIAGGIGLLLGTVLRRR